MAEFVCIASGPSVTAEQIAIVKRWREGAADRRVIVVNSTWRLAPWADALFAMDSGWWKAYLPDVRAGFQGRIISSWAGAGGVGIEQARSIFKRFDPCGNSGAGAIMVAKGMDATRVYLVGYDCRIVNGRKHHHPDHPRPMGNAGSMHKWPEQFGRALSLMAGVPVINCTPGSALRCFPSADLAQALCPMAEAA